MRYYERYFAVIAAILIAILLPATPVFGRSSRAETRSKAANRPQTTAAATKAARPQQTKSSTTQAASRARASAPAKRTTAVAAPKASAPANRTAQRSTVRPQQRSKASVSRSSNSSRSVQSRASVSVPSQPKKPTASRSQVSSRPATSNSSRNRATQSRPVNRTVKTTSKVSSTRSTSARIKTPSVSSGSVASNSLRSRATRTRPVNRTVEVASTGSSSRSASTRRKTSSVSSSKSYGRTSRTIVPGVSSGRGSKTSGSLSTESRVSRTAKTTPASVVRKIETRGSKAKKTTRAVSTAKSGTTYDFYGSSSNRTSRKKRTDASNNRADRPSRIKVIEVDNRSRGTSGNTVAKNRSSVRLDPKQSTAASVVDTKHVSRRTAGRRKASTSTVASGNTVRLTPRTEKTTTINNNTTLVTATDLSTRSPALRTSPLRTRRDEPQVVINNNNTVVVQGNTNTSYSRPHIASRRLAHDIGYVHKHRRWQSHSGIYFSFIWSNSSCGRIAYLPYRYHHSWCRYPYTYRPYYGLSYYYPRYHRKYIFVSIGGYWPTWYRYRRYYWYGCHPYYWYGPHVISEPYRNVTYNTYNYYSTEPSGYSVTESSQTYYSDPVQDSSDVFVDEPTFQTPADLCFANAIELFEAGNYADAAAQFREAVLLSPDDIVLPFTYSQALFANGDYAHAASVLREAIAQIPDDELTIYYPRGLYKDEDLLTEQIAHLEAAAAKEPFDSDYQLLLGYQYLGIGDMDKAHQPLTEAATNTTNALTAGKLLELSAELEDKAPVIE